MYNNHAYDGISLNSEWSIETFKTPAARAKFWAPKLRIHEPFESRFRNAPAAIPILASNDYKSIVFFQIYESNHHRHLWMSVFGHPDSTFKQYMVACPNDDGELQGAFQTLLQVIDDVEISLIVHEVLHTLLIDICESWDKHLRALRLFLARNHNRQGRPIFEQKRLAFVKSKKVALLFDSGRQRGLFVGHMIRHIIMESIFDEQLQFCHSLQWKRRPTEYPSLF